MKRILLVTDGSLNGARAAQTAADLARRSQGEVFIIYVVPPVPTLARRAVSQGEAELRDIVATLRKQMQAGHRALDRAGRILQQAGIAHRAWLEQGTPAALAVTIAREKQCDAIVVGSGGLDRTTRLALGEKGLRSKERELLVIIVS